MSPISWSAFVKEASALRWAMDHPLHVMAGGAAAIVGGKELKKNYTAINPRLQTSFQPTETLPRHKRPNPLYGPSATGIY